MNKKEYINIPLAYLKDESGNDVLDYDYMRILFEKKLDILFNLDV